MADYLLLKDQGQCPRCRCDRVIHFRQCINCGTMLFTRPIQFSRYEDEGGFKNYWLFDALRGWIHRDAIMVDDFSPNEREYKAPKLDPDYGRQTTPEAVRAQGGKLKLKGKIKKAPRRFY